MNKKLYFKLAIIGLLTLMVGTFTHCVQNTPLGGSNASSSSRNPSSTPTAQTPEQVLNQAQLDMGIRNFEQINYTFSELTGVPVSTNAINNTFNAVTSTLPTGNDAKVLQASNQVAVTRLASEYCNQLITVGTFNANRNTLFGAGLFSTSYNNLTSAQVQSFVNQTTNAFWGQGTIDQVELDAARDELLMLFSEIGDAESATNKASTNITSGATSKSVRAVCTAALSSAYVIMM